LAVSFVRGLKGLVTLLLFLYVTGEAGRKYVRYMPWPQAAECNMITNKTNFIDWYSMLQVHIAFVAGL